MPELYHVYAGHDTNRDWFMLNLKETQLLTRLLYHEWFPTIHYDVHQMGSRGARIFVPVAAPTSRATPITDIRSGRFGVTAMSSTASSSPKCRLKSTPTVVSGGRMRIPP